jgi:hypothetical protein
MHKLRQLKNIIHERIGSPQEKLEATKERQELSDVIRFENILRDRIQELNLKPKDSSNLSEGDIHWNVFLSISLT